MTIQEALEHKEAYLLSFQQHLEAKVAQIKRSYSRENLNEKQLHFLQQDESFCKSSEALVNVLLHQIEFLQNQMQLDREMLTDATMQVTSLQESLINSMIENNRLKKEYGTLEFKFNEAC